MNNNKIKSFNENQNMINYISNNNNNQDEQYNNYGKQNQMNLNENNDLTKGDDT